MRLLLLLLALVPAAAWADAPPDGFIPDPGRPGWRGQRPDSPAVWQTPPRAYDPPLGGTPSGGPWRGAPVGFIPVPSWRGAPVGFRMTGPSWGGAPRGWLPPATAMSTWRGSDAPPAPPEWPLGLPDGPAPQPPNGGHLPGVPGPAAAPGLAAALLCARRIRRRLSSHRSASHA